MLKICNLRLLRTFAGVLRENFFYAHHFKGKHGNPYIVGKINKCRFRGGEICIAGFFNSAKENRKQPQK